MPVSCFMLRLALVGALSATVIAQSAASKKRLLVIGEEKGYRHEAVTHAMATIERLGRDTGLWNTVIRTDTEALTKSKLEYNAKTLNDFDARALLYRRHPGNGRPEEGRLHLLRA